MSELPGDLRAALERALDGVPRKGLAERARATSDAYRAGKPSSGVIREADDALAYALTRLPATYAACAAVFDEAARMAPGFRPAGILDAGAGTAAASWAALETWPGISAATWLDASPPFLTLAARLAAEGAAPLRTADARRADLTGGGPWPKADLVVASYALAEIAPDRQGRRGPVPVGGLRRRPGAGRARHAGGIRAHPGRPRGPDRRRGAHPCALPA